MLRCLDNRAFFSCHFLLASSSNRNLFMFMYGYSGSPAAGYQFMECYWRRSMRLIRSKLCFKTHRLKRFKIHPQDQQLIRSQSKHNMSIELKRS